MVSEIISYRGKSALREVGKVFGLSLDQVDRLASDRRRTSTRRRSRPRASPRPASTPRRAPSARSLTGPARSRASRVTSRIHVGGFVLSASRSPASPPIEPARMPDRTVIPWDKDDLDDLGFFKIDVLALGHAHRHPQVPGRSTQRDHAGPRAPVRHRGARPIPAEDPAVYDALCSAPTWSASSRSRAARRCRCSRGSAQQLLRPRHRGRDRAPRARSRAAWSTPTCAAAAGEERADPPHPCLDADPRADARRPALPGAGDADRDGRRRLHGRRGRPAPPRHGRLEKTGRLERHREQAPRRLRAPRDLRASSASSSTSRSTASASTASPSRHAASFALLVYASRLDQGAPPGRVRRARSSTRSRWVSTAPRRSCRTRRRHGVEVRPPCVVAQRLGLDAGGDTRGDRRGRCASASASSAASARPPAKRVTAAARRGALRVVARSRATAPRSKKNEIEALAEAGALARLVPARREALWRARAPREGGLFEGLAIEPDEDVGLPAAAPARAARARLRPRRPLGRRSPDGPSPCAPRRARRAARGGARGDARTGRLWRWPGW